MKSNEVSSEMNRGGTYRCYNKKEVSVTYTAYSASSQCQSCSHLVSELRFT